MSQTLKRSDGKKIIEIHTYSAEAERIFSRSSSVCSVLSFIHSFWRQTNTAKWFNDFSKHITVGFSVLILSSLFVPIFFLIWFILRFGFRNDASSAAFYADSFFSSIIFFFFIFPCRCDRIRFFRPLDVGRWLVWCCVVTLFMNAIASFKSMLLISIPMITILKGFDDNIHFYRGEKKLHLGRFNFDSSVCGSCFLFSLTNLWTTGRICLLMVFQLNCSIGFAVKLPDLICVFHFNRWMSVLIFFSLSRALLSIPDFSTCVQLFPPALKHTM